jgi:hypothetical protein
MLKRISSLYSNDRNPRIVMGAMQMGGTQSLVTADNICFRMCKGRGKGLPIICNEGTEEYRYSCTASDLLGPNVGARWAG